MLFVLGLAIAAVRIADTETRIGWVGVTRFEVIQISSSDWAVGLLQGALPQVPTTLLNSCIAVCHLADDLYPHRQTGVNVRSVSASVGLINVVFCWFGALPMCHGSGGLAGQYRFGARTNLAVLTLGLFKLILGLFLADPLLAVLRFFPTSILAGMLAISAFELAAAARTALTADAEKVRLCLLTCCFTVFCGTAVGFFLGLVAWMLLGVTALVIGPSESVAAARAELQTLHGKLSNWKSLTARPRQREGRDV